MTEAAFIRRCRKRWEAAGGWFYKIPDSPTGKMDVRPFDAIAVLNGKSYALEFKVQDGGKTLNLHAAMRGRTHQARSLARFAEAIDTNGHAFLVVGWRPNGERAYRTLWFSSSEVIEALENEGLLDLTTKNSWISALLFIESLRGESHDLDGAESPRPQ